MAILPDCPSDNCPECLEGPNRPHTARSDGRGGLVGAYRCPGCGDTWTCSWRIESLARKEINDDVA